VQEQLDTYQNTSRLVKSNIDGKGDNAKSADSDEGIPITRPSELLEAVLAAGRKGLAFQRYKGLGEMNAEQLWETTLDPDVRTLLQVSVEQADLTDEIFFHC